MNDLLVGIGLVTNLVSSVAIIQVNKYIYVNYNYPNLSLTFIHFIVTFFGLYILNKAGVFQRAQVKLLEMLPISISFCGFVVLTNYSLQLNSVGTYQCFKALTSPVVILLSVYYKQVPVLMGVVLNSMYDLKFVFFGVVIALIAAVVTSFYQVWIEEKQRKLNINALQLLFYQAPLSASLLLLLIPFMEPIKGETGALSLMSSYSKLVVIILSGVLAFLVNLSIYWIIGNLSALTYNMVGFVKFVLTILFGILLFEDAININQLFAMFLVILGIISYSYFKIQEKKINESKNNNSNNGLVKNELTNGNNQSKV